MIGLIQRVSHASVAVDDEIVGKINQGLLVLLGVERQDNAASTAKLLKKIHNYRVFEDEAGKMNLSLAQIGGELLVVSQFTLTADTAKGLRPGFSQGAAPELAEDCYQEFIRLSREQGITTESGRFGADMQVSLLNDGPVTFSLKV